MTRARAAIPLAALLAAGCATAPVDRGDPPVERVWEVMGTQLRVQAWAREPARASAAAAAARVAVFRIDSLMSIYRPESELSRINRRAGTDSATVVSAETAEVLSAALAYARWSGSALDVTVGPLMDVWGFYRRAGALPAAAALDSAAALVGHERVEFDSTARAVRLPHRGRRLDFGAIAKGYAVDVALAAMQRAGASAGLVDLGGNLGAFGAAPDGKGWTVGLPDPRRPDDVFALVQMERGAVATSGDYEQFVEIGGVRYSHIMDPRVQRPSRGVASVSVFAPTGMMADALSTALFVLGPETGCRLLATLRGVEAVWVRAPAPGADALVVGQIVLSDGLAGRIALGLDEPGTAATCAELRR